MSFFLFLFIFGCTESNKIIPESYLYKIFENKEIFENPVIYGKDTILDPKIIDGQMTVFKYEYQKEHDANVIDDEYVEEMCFQISTNVDSILIENSYLDSANCFFGFFYEGPKFGWHKADSGFITGNKISDSLWHIESNISGFRKLDSVNIKRNNLELEGNFIK